MYVNICNLNARKAVHKNVSQIFRILERKAEYHDLAFTLHSNLCLREVTLQGNISKSESRFLNS